VDESDGTASPARTGDP